MAFLRALHDRSVCKRSCTEDAKSCVISCSSLKAEDAGGLDISLLQPFSVDMHIASDSPSNKAAEGKKYILTEDRFVTCEMVLLIVKLFGSWRLGKVCV